ncbi:MAG: porin family protein [Alphaproteobacteria bacterium]|nr:porin family protein [Alphaproteobacteria bacterium]
MQKAIWGAVAAASLVLGSAQAADLPIYKAAPPAAPTFSWTGLYIGADVGGRRAIVDPSVTSIVGSIGGTPGASLFPVVCPATGCSNGPSLDSSGFRGGFYAGYNYQVSPQWVLGIEGDWGWANSRKALSGLAYPNSAFAPLGFLAGFGTAPDASFSVAAKWDASVRGRVGFLMTPSILLYLAGGASWLKVEETSNCTASFCGPVGGSGVLGPIAIANASVRTGWTIGGGGEMNLWGNWLARAEYRYADYGSWNNTDSRTCSNPLAGCLFLTATGLTVGTSMRLQTHTGLFGLAYKF